MSDTYETWIQLPLSDLAVHSSPDLSAQPRPCEAPPSVGALYWTRKVAGRFYLVVSINQEQAQAPFEQAAEEEADQNIPLDFDLTEASFRGLPPGVNAGKQEREKAHHFVSGFTIGAHAAPIAGTVEEACVTLSSFPATHWFGQPMHKDGRVASWVAEAEAKRWRGDMEHILRSCNICGRATPLSDPTCNDCMPLFRALWAASGVGDRGSSEILAAWNHELRSRESWKEQFAQRHHTPSTFHSNDTSFRALGLASGSTRTSAQQQ